MEQKKTKQQLLFEIHIANSHTHTHEHKHIY
jgi:hypothetical protein